MLSFIRHWEACTPLLCGNLEAIGGCSISTRHCEACAPVDYGGWWPQLDAEFQSGIH